MKLLRKPSYITGFLWEDPMEELPAITHGGEAVSERGFSIPSHSHISFEFLYLSRGEMDWKVGSQVFSQKMGDLMVFLPGESHRTDQSAREASHRIWLGVDLEKLGTAGRNLANRLKRHKLRLLPRTQSVELILQAVIRQIVSNLPSRHEVILNYLRVLVALVEQRQRLLQSEQATPERTQLPYSYAVEKTVSHMERYLDRHIPLEELASIGLFSQVANFCTQFKKEVGLSPAAYHLQLRLDAARTELLQPDASITVVAHQFGFSSSQHFSTAFSQAFHMSPRAWREQALQKPALPSGGKDN